MGIYEELQARGLIAQVTDEELIRMLRGGQTDITDFLMEKYPVHFGCIKLEQLNREAEKKISTCTNYENKVSGDKLKQMHPDFQKTLLSIYLLTQRDLFKIRYEIDFIKDMCMDMTITTSR